MTTMLAGGRAVASSGDDKAFSASILRLVAACAVLVAVAFQQEPGLTVVDTKLDLTQDPTSFLERALRLWEPTVAFGQLQNQAYGYLFPMGPFFAGTQMLGADPYLAGRLWWSLLLVAGFLGTIAVLAALGIDSEVARVLGAFTYVLAPHTAAVLGPISSEAMPALLAPWMLLPLVRATQGRLGARRAAGLSALAVAAIGAVNAVATVSVIPFGLVWILVMSRGSLRRRLIGWWALAGTLATAWWVVPLVLLGRYSFPFLDYIESASATTANTSAGEVLRGSSHWIGYLPAELGSPWRAGALVATEPAVIVLGAAVAALGVAGLLRSTGRVVPAQAVWLTCLLIGVAIMVAPWPGVGSSPLAPTWQQLLDGPLAPIRNVHKVDPLVRLPIAVGLAWLVMTLRPVPAAGLTLTRVRGAISVLLVGACAPLLVGLVAPTGSFAQVPAYWGDAARYLDARAEGTTTLMVPGDGFGRYRWGRTSDEPLQTLLEGPWASRQQVGPIAGTGVVRMLDEIEERLARSEEVPGLAEYLASVGVGYVLARNDLDWPSSGAPRPEQIRASLEASDGIERVASFGPSKNGGREGPLVVDDGIAAAIPALEIYRVRPGAQRVRALPADQLTLLGGDAEAALDLAAAGGLGDAPVVIAGEPLPEGLEPTRVVASDTLRRREMGFGAIRDNTSHTLAAGEVPRSTTVATDLRSVPTSPAETVSVVGGVRAVTASSSASGPGALIDRDRTRHPFAAIDADPDTSWASGTVSVGGQQWWRVDLSTPRPVEGLRVGLGSSQVDNADLSALTVRTERGERTTPVRAGALEVEPLVPQGPTRWLELRAEEFGDSATGRGSFALDDVSLPGLTAARTMAVPTRLGDAAADQVLLTSSDGARSGCLPVEARLVCSPRPVQRNEEAGRFDRTVLGTVAEQDLAGLGLDASMSVRGLAALTLLGADRRTSSTWVDHPADSAFALVDGQRDTSWRPDTDDPSPSITLSWDRPRPVGVVRLVLDRSGPASAPTRARIRVGRETFDTRLTPVSSQRPGADEVSVEARFPVIRTSRLSVELTDADVVVSQADGEPAVTLERMPIGVAELQVPAIDDLLDGLRGRVVISCEEGPAVEVDGRRIGLRADTTGPVLVRGEAVQWTACGSDPDPDLIRWPAGDHRIIGTTMLDVRSATLTLTRASASTTAPRAVTLGSWGSARREVRVGAGGQAVLQVAENHNPGWVARTEDGTALDPVRLEGWKQGWVLPAGPETTVVIEFTPQPVYQASLAGGALALAALTPLALWPDRRRRPPRSRPSEQPSPRSRPGPALAVVSATMAVIGGVSGLVSVGIAALAERRWPGRIDVVAGAALFAAGVVTASSRVARWPWPELSAGLAHLLGLVVVSSVALILAARTSPSVEPSAPDAPPGPPPRGESPPPSPGRGRWPAD